MGRQGGPGRQRRPGESGGRDLILGERGGSAVFLRGKGGTAFAIDASAVSSAADSRTPDAGPTPADLKSALKALRKRLRLADLKARLEASGSS